MAAHPLSPRDPSPASFCPLSLGQSTLTKSKNPCSHSSCTPHCRFKYHHPSLAPLLLQLIITVCLNQLVFVNLRVNTLQPFWKMLQHFLRKCIRVTIGPSTCTAGLTLMRVDTHTHPHTNRSRKIIAATICRSQKVEATPTDKTR